MNLSTGQRLRETEAWYVIRVVPGGQRMARAVPGAAEDRIGETLLERECREKGISIFMPSFWTVVRHQRTNKLIEKRFPLLVGYAFVRIREEGFDSVRRLNYVSYFLRGGGYYGLASFSDDAIVQLYLAELEARDQHAVMKRNGEADVRKHRRAVLGNQLGLIFPKGRRKKVPVRMLAAAAINSLAPKAKERCVAILKELETLDKEEAESCKQGRAALNSAA